MAITLISVLRNLALHTLIRLRLDALTTETDGQIIGVGTNSQAMQLNGMIQMVTGTATTGTIQNGMLPEIQIGQANL